MPGRPQRYAAAALLLLAACARTERPPESGNVARGRELIVVNQCYDCHTIPGIDQKPGPGVPTSLAGLAERRTLGNGAVPNTRANLEQYIQKPRSLNPASVMPGMGERPADAHDIGAYLMTLD